MFVHFTTTDTNLYIADAVIWCPCYASIIAGATLELHVSQTNVVTKMSLRFVVRSSSHLLQP
jgi:hypothetical protein